MEISFFNDQEILQSDLFDQWLRLHSETFGSAYTTEVIKELPYKQKALLVVAHLKDQLVGFKLGYEQGIGQFYSWTGAVNEEYRGKGIGQELMNIQHEECAKRGYNLIQTKTKNSWRSMLILNLKSGFDIIGTYTDSQGEPKLILQKQL